MPSVLTHAVVGIALGQGAGRTWRRDWRFWCLAVSCSMLPDIDVIGFRLGIRYGDVWGHRGMTHSILFATVCGILLSVLLANSWRDRRNLAIGFVLLMVLHGALDALTNGGLGVAFLSPFDLHRYFFRWRPIRVSPFTAARFLSLRGLHVLWSEILCLWTPGAIVGALLYWRSRRQRRASVPRWNPELQVQGDAPGGRS